MRLDAVAGKPRVSIVVFVVCRWSHRQLADTLHWLECSSLFPACRSKALVLLEPNTCQVPSETLDLLMRDLAAAVAGELLREKRS